MANAATHARREVIVVDGTPIMVAVPGSGITPLEPAPSAEHGSHHVPEHVVVTEHSMNNGLIAVGWNLDGEVTSIIDVAHGREVLPTGRRITLELAPDHPVEYDAWDVERWTSSLGDPITGDGSIELVAADSLMAQLVVRRAFGRSSATQTYTIRAASSRLDITLDIDWHEDEKLLSVMIPLDVRSDVASCDVQFGHVKRPTHASNSWDAAKFEVCAHRYVDLSEPSFGVAVLNDGRYGHGVHEGGVRVSLLRATKYPDPNADHGRHSVTVSVLPHGPGLHDVLHEAEALNLPLRIVRGYAESAPEPVVTIDHHGVQISSVKQADEVPVICSCASTRPAAIGRRRRCELHSGWMLRRGATSWRSRPRGSNAPTGSSWSPCTPSSWSPCGCAAAEVVERHARRTSSVPVTIASSSKITRLEWFGAAVAGLRSACVPPRNTIAPGTCCST